LGAGRLIDLGILDDGETSYAMAVSADGTVVVGRTFGVPGGQGDRAFRWTPATGMVSLGNGFASGVNADGSVVVGWWQPKGAFRWTQASGMVSLGTLSGFISSVATGVNADGSVVVGNAVGLRFQNELFFRGFRWTQATGMVSLGTVSSNAEAVNADGTVVVGWSSKGAFRWTQASGMVSLGKGHASGVNADGTVVVGSTFDAAAKAIRAFRWTQASGMVSLGTLNGRARSYANGVSADGKVVVGEAFDTRAKSQAFRWTQATGMISVRDWLAANGVKVAPEWQPIYANGTNADGSIVVGTMSTSDGDRAYLARVGGFGNGMINLEHFTESLSSSVPQRVTFDAANAVLHGAHNNPLLGRVAAGKFCVWATGDGGRDDHDSRDGSLGVAEFGACHRLASGAQLNAAVGATRARQDLVFDGDIRHDSRYVLVEGLAPRFESNVWVTVSGYYGWGDARIRRGYLNAGGLDTSSGTPDVATWALRARLDWDNALRAGDAGFTPYGELSYIRAEADAYTETGGGFPARFDARSETNTELRAGINAIKPPSNRTRLLATMEWVHRFDDEGARTTGQVLGLFPFDLPGTQYKRDWLRGGVGIDSKVGGGTASVMLNATTLGQDPSYWLSASYRLAF